MITKRIIPCLDIKNGKTVKGINFMGLRDAGDPIELAERYSRSGADELVFLDISATEEGRETLVDLVSEIAKRIKIPFTVGGGVKSVQDAKRLLRAGADKIAINSAAVKCPDLINEIANALGSQCVVVAVDAKEVDGEWLVHLVGGKVPTSIRLLDWCIEAQERGAGEILFTSMNNDGTKTGFAIEPLKIINDQLNIPIIASGGAGTSQDFIDVFEKTDVSAALAASVFHFGEIALPELKIELKNSGVWIR